MIVSVAAYVTLCIGERNVESEILITPDLERLILGIDWLKQQGRFKWHFERGRIKFGDEDWIELRPERVAPTRARRFVQDKIHYLSEEEERELTPDWMCIRNIRVPNLNERKCREDTSVLVRENRRSRKTELTSHSTVIKFVGESPRSWIDKPDALAAVQRWEVNGLPLMRATKPEELASGEAEESALGEAEELASEEACVVAREGAERFSSAVSSADAPSETLDGDVSQGLKGHSPILPICYASPVNPSLRTQSWGDVVPPWDEGIPSTVGCDVQKFMTMNEAPHSIDNGQIEANQRLFVDNDPEENQEDSEEDRVDIDLSRDRVDNMAWLNRPAKTWLNRPVVRGNLDERSGEEDEEDDEGNESFSLSSQLENVHEAQRPYRNVGRPSHDDEEFETQFRPKKRNKELEKQREIMPVSAK